MSLENVIQLHSNLLNRELTDYEHSLIRSAYYTGWSEAILKVEEVMGDKLNREELKKVFDKSE